MPPLRTPIRLEVMGECGLSPNEIPPQYADHPLVAGRWYYTLPERLLDLLIQSRVTESFDEESLRMERALSRRLGNHAVGYFRGAPISYLHEDDSTPVPETPELARALNWPESLIERLDAVRAATELVSRHSLVLRAYAGWLLTNRHFVDEHDELLAAHRALHAAGGFPKPILARCDAHEPIAVLPPGPEEAVAIPRFYERWRLQSLEGPYLPCPLPILLPSPLHAQHGGISAAAGMTTICVPDIVPLTGHGAFRDAADGALQRSSAPSHLRDWMAIVDASNASRNTIARFARLHQVQHFLRLLHARYSTGLRRRKTRLLSALSDFMGTSEDSLKRDWAFIDGALGSDWLRRPDPVIE
jgi:hypothetical protein